MNTKTSLITCEACGEGHLHPKTGWDDVEYKGQHGKIHHHYSICDVCGSELADAKQLLENKREWVRFRKQVDNVPLGYQIAEMRKRFNLTQAEAGQLFGGGPVAFCKYEHDDILPDGAMSNLLYLIINHEDTVYKLAARKNISLPHSVQIDYVLDWFMDKQKVASSAVPLVNEFYEAIKKSFHGKAFKKHVLSPKAPVTEMEFAFGNGWNGEKQTWTM
jgi:HTH-type transcriptional regulator / antitoxin MqsA